MTMRTIFFFLFTLFQFILKRSCAVQVSSMRLNNIQNDHQDSILSWPQGMAIYFPNKFNHNHHGSLRDNKENNGDFTYRDHDNQVDEEACLYVADTFNHKIRKITLSGKKLFNLAGYRQNEKTKKIGYKDGKAQKALFHRPYGVAVGLDGTVYVTDTGNHRIRKITKIGFVYSLLGQRHWGLVTSDDLSSKMNSRNGTFDHENLLSEKDEAYFEKPTGILVHPKDGNIYVSDTKMHHIRRITPDGEITVIAGSPDGFYGYQDEDGLGARFHRPEQLGIASDGSILVSDSGNYRTRVIHLDKRAKVTTYPIRFLAPSGFAYDSKSNLYVSTQTSIIYKVTSDLRLILIAGNSVGMAGMSDGDGDHALFNKPNSIVIDSRDRLYILDSLNNRIRFIDLNSDSVHKI